MPHKQLILRYKAPTTGVAEQVGHNKFYRITKRVKVHG